MRGSPVLVGMLLLGAVALVIWVVMRAEPSPATLEAGQGLADREDDDEPALTAGGTRDGPEGEASLTAEREPGTAPLGDAVREIDLRGVVVDEAGEPLPGATVFVVPKEIDGVPLGGLAETPHVDTDEEGHWKLTRSSMPSYWLGAMAADHLPAHLDGDLIDPRADQRLILKRSDPLVLEVVDAEGRPAEGATVLVRTRHDDERTHAYPGAHAEGNFGYSHTLKAHERELTLRPGTTAPVVVSVRRGGHYAEPDDLLCDPPSGRFTIRVLPVCRVKIVVTDATTGAPLQQGFSWVLLRGEEKMGGATTNPGGVMEAQHSWMRPGTYRVEVRSLRYERRLTESFALDTPGATRTVEVALEQDADLGDLRVRLSGMDDLPDIVLPGGETRRPGVNFWWRRAGTSAWATVPRDQMFGWPVVQTGDEYMATALPPGETDVFAYHHGSRRAGLLRSVQILRGKTNTVTLDMAAGLFCAVAGPANRLRVRTASGDALPAFLTVEGGMSSWGDEDTLEAGTVKLGPYPGDALDVEWIDGEGKSHTKRVERQASGPR